jgi:hypothetical protein
MNATGKSHTMISTFFFKLHVYVEIKTTHISQYIYLHCEIKKIITSLLFSKKIFIQVTLVAKHCCSSMLRTQRLIIFTLISCETSHYGNDYLQCHFLSFSDYLVKLQ